MTLREEIHAYIENISENKLMALKPLLFALANEPMIVTVKKVDENNADATQITANEPMIVTVKKVEQVEAKQYPYPFQAFQTVTIEQDLTEEERDLIAVGISEYEANPNSFIALDDVK